MYTSAKQTIGASPPQVSAAGPPCTIEHIESPSTRQYKTININIQVSKEEGKKCTDLLLCFFKLLWAHTSKGIYIVMGAAAPCTITVQSLRVWTVLPQTMVRILKGT